MFVQGLYPPDLLRSAILNVPQVALRAETYARALDFYVDGGHLRSLDSADWQIIVGRRGSGKSLLLRAFAESRDALPNGRHWVEVFSANRFKLTVGADAASFTFDQLALATFQAFTSELMFRLDQKMQTHSINKRERTGESWLSAIFAAEDSVVENSRYRFLRAEFDKAIKFGGPISGLSTYSSEVGEVQSKKTTRKGAASAALDLTRGPFAAAADAKIANERTDTTEATLKAIHLIRPQLGEARRQLFTLMDYVGLERITILIDEWSDLNPPEMRPFMAGYLRDLLGNDDRLRLKIAINDRTEVFSWHGRDQSVGLEVGADIFEGLTLERSYPLDIGDVRFFREALLKRLLAASPSLGVISSQYPLDDQIDTLIASMFAAPKVHLDLVEAADGLPRRYFELLNALIANSLRGESWPWRDIHISKVLRDHGGQVEDQLKSLKQDFEARFLDGIVRPIIERTNLNLILVRRADVAAHQQMFDDLFLKRLIRIYRRSAIPNEISKNYSAMAVDSGLWYLWAPKPKTAIEPTAALVGLRASDWQPYLADMSILERLRLCQHCGEMFNTSSPSFLIKGLCPNCFEVASN